jgi:RNA polymerase sigma-70 factor (ECF subfamily)
MEDAGRAKSVTKSALGRRGRSSGADAGDEAGLMARIARRDLRAFEDLYRAYHPRLTRFLMTMTRRPPLVEEVLDDTMMVVWNRPERFNGSSRLSTWIFAIAYRTALGALRRQDQPVEEKGADQRPAPEPDPEQELGDRQVQAVLLSALDDLSSDHRAVVDLTYFHDMGYREIAEIMDCPVDTVKTRMFHARRHLKRILSGQLADWL